MNSERKSELLGALSAESLARYNKAEKEAKELIATFSNPHGVEFALMAASDALLDAYRVKFLAKDELVRFTELLGKTIVVAIDLSEEVKVIMAAKESTLSQGNTRSPLEN